MKDTSKILTLCFLLIPFFSNSQILKERNQTLGDFLLKQELSKAIKINNQSNSPDTLIKSKESAIEYAEPILFKTYGKSQILKEKPYKINFADGIWTIRGTLHSGKGGVFLIQINSLDGKVTQITHGK